MSNYLSNNIFLITLDALSARYMEIYDNEHFSEFFEEKAKTPFLKEFLKDSVKFNKCYTNSNMTIVSTRQFQEGRYVSYPMSQKEKGDIPLTTNALSIKLKEAGYNTCAYLGDGDWIFRAMEAVYNEYKIISDGIEFIVDKSKNWLSNNKENKTFLWLHVSDTHMCAAPKHLDKDIGGYGSWDKFKNFDKTKFLCRFKEKPNSDLNIMLAYAKSISYCDFILNDFFNFIKKLGIYEKSTIIISADHLVCEFKKSIPFSPNPLSTKSVLFTLYPALSNTLLKLPSPQAHSQILGENVSNSKSNLPAFGSVA